MAVSDEAKPNPTAEDNGGSGSQRAEKIDIVVVHDGSKTTLKVRPTTNFMKIMTAIEDKYGAQKGTFKFLYDGKRIQPSDTPDELGMEHEDQVDVFLEQVGGGVNQ